MEAYVKLVQSRRISEEKRVEIVSKYSWELGEAQLALVFRNSEREKAALKKLIVDFAERREEEEGYNLNSWLGSFFADDSQIFLRWRLLERFDPASFKGFIGCMRSKLRKEYNCWSRDAVDNFASIEPQGNNQIDDEEDICHAVSLGTLAKHKTFKELLDPRTPIQKARILAAALLHSSAEARSSLSCFELYV